MTPLDQAMPATRFSVLGADTPIIPTTPTSAMVGWMWTARSDRPAIKPSGASECMSGLAGRRHTLQPGLMEGDPSYASV